MDYSAIVFSPEMLCGDENDIARIRYVAPVVDGRLQVRRVASSSSLLQMFDQAVELLQNREVSYELRVRARLLEIFASLAETGKNRVEEAEKASSKAVKAAIDYIRENYKKQISIEELAKLCHMSDGHFCRMFKKYTFKTPVQYMNSVRLSAAMDLLTRTDRKVLDIALDTGFQQPELFYRRVQAGAWVYAHAVSQALSGQGLWRMIFGKLLQSGILFIEKNIGKDVVCVFGGLRRWFCWHVCCFGCGR